MQALDLPGAESEQDREATERDQRRPQARLQEPISEPDHGVSPVIAGPV